MARLTRLGRLALLLLLTAAPAVQAQTPALPTLTQPVNDFGRVIDAASAAELDRIIRALQKASGDVIVIATVKTLEPYGTIEEYAVRLFESSKVGEADKHNGALILVAVDDRKVRIEVGYGLEEFITDGYAGDLIRTRLLPAFRQGQYGPGLVDATRTMAWRLADARGVTLEDARPANRGDDDGSPGGMAPLLVFIAIWLLVRWLASHGGGPAGFNRRRRGMWGGWYGGVGGFGGGFGSGGVGGGGFGGFGGGRSGGGGASGGW